MRFTLTGHLGLSGLISCAQGPHVAHGYLIRQYSFRLKTEVLTPPLDLFSLSGQFSLTLFCVCPFFFFSVLLYTPGKVPQACIGTSGRWGGQSETGRGYCWKCQALLSDRADQSPPHLVRTSRSSLT